MGETQCCSAGVAFFSGVSSKFAGVLRAIATIKERGRSQNRQPPPQPVKKSSESFVRPAPMRKSTTKLSVM
ncbi:hypothetical protein V22_21150 [Calycomorphotria hydatis]|uniref:Uncharacterized protein n=1 Tax=Calycomorphotria hydatis TaxID=2528027 RepID=A0A517T914_9PLAN|nr:hypothetical protein V22_21150 [Calycomorphotria hydatis]